MLSHWTEGLPISLSRMDREPQASSCHHFPITEITGAHCHTHIVSHGFWGLELRLSGLYNNDFTHWAISSALFAVVILFPKVTNHISTTWAISRRRIKPRNVILLLHVGGIGEQKRNCFCSRSHEVWNQNFLCPIISLLTKLPLKHFLPLLGHLSGSARHKDKGSETLGKPLFFSLSKMVRLCEPPRTLKRWVERNGRGPEQCPLFLGSP